MLININLYQNITLPIRMVAALGAKDALATAVAGSDFPMLLLSSGSGALSHSATRSDCL